MGGKQNTIFFWFLIFDLNGLNQGQAIRKFKPPSLYSKNSVFNIAINQKVLSISKNNLCIKWIEPVYTTKFFCWTGVLNLTLITIFELEHEACRAGINWTPRTVIIV